METAKHTENSSRIQTRSLFWKDEKLLKYITPGSSMSLSLWWNWHDLLSFSSCANCTQIYRALNGTFERWLFTFKRIGKISSQG